jgi:hypothetical protein
VNKAKKRYGQIAGLVLILLSGFFVFRQNHSNHSKINVVKVPSELMIKATVYQDLLGHPSKEAAKRIGAYFLEANEQDKAYLQPFFANWQPRVEVGETNDVAITKTNVIDRLTGKPARLFWARVKSLSNHIAQVTGGLYETPEAGVEYQYQLVFDGTNWVIQSKNQRLVW